MRDVLLVGASGQVGRYILRDLIWRGASIEVVVRSHSVPLIENELRNFGASMTKGVSITVGDAMYSDLPPARHVFNCAGYTGLDDNPVKYWQANIMLASKLAMHARESKAIYHYVSTESVAVWTPLKLFEATPSRPDHRQTTYSLSKVLGEKVAESLVPREQSKIYRICDVVPDIIDMGRDWRRNHWLSVLYWCGKYGFEQVPPDHDFFIETGSELARQIATIMFSDIFGRFHVLGHPYTYEYLGQYATRSNPPEHIAMRLGRRLAKILVRGPKMTECIDDGYTKSVLHALGYKDSGPLGDKYWTTFDRQAAGTIRVVEVEQV